MTNHIVPQFIEIPASKSSIAHRRPIYGVGINDADYVSLQTINGQEVRCPFYTSWKRVLTRCYNNNFHKESPTYIHCTIAHEWLTFSNFRLWMENHDWKNKDLDKDILSPGNKHYSPETCVFVSRELNLLLTDAKANRGKHPKGVSFHKGTKKFRAYCMVNGKQKHLGYFTTKESASEAYKLFKSNHIKQIAHQQADERIKNGLLLHAQMLIGDNNANS